MAHQPRATIYARVLTDEQSPDAQLGDRGEYAGNRGLEQVTELVDHGESGSKPSSLV